ncbi:MAG: tRNA (pseudouridine(54)-N(1))-methyltransferase TrmY [Methanomicrobiales archaeon]|nr:tRNA (pseudouridine(54)-N(1))-methyltransferase TrmY [Methanomicrobiales archaeon]
MTSFLIIGHTASTDPSFSLNDLPGKAGRMDLLCRTVSSSLFLSHGIRQNIICDILLLGPPYPGRLIRFIGNEIKNLSPDERNIASFIKIGLAIPAGKTFRQASQGLYCRKAALADLLAEQEYAVLDESGTDIRTVPAENIPDAFILSDNRNYTEEEQSLIAGLTEFSLGPAIVHADHAITLLLNETDRRKSGWN